MSDDRDIDDMIDLAEMGPEETSEFFLHLVSHALAGQQDAIYAHIQQVAPSPANVMYLMMGMAQGMSALSKAIMGKHPDQVQLKFGVFSAEEDMPDQKAVLDGDEDARAALDGHAVDIDRAPRPLRIAGQLMSAGISGDSELAYALALPLCKEYDELLESDQDLEPSEIDALNCVLALAQGLVQYAAMFDEDAVITGLVDQMVEEIEAG